MPCRLFCCFLKGRRRGDDPPLLPWRQSPGDEGSAHLIREPGLTDSVEANVKEDEVVAENIQCDKVLQSSGDNNAVSASSHRVKPFIPMIKGLSDLNSYRPDNTVQIQSADIEEKQEEVDSESDESPENLSSQEADGTLRLTNEAAAEAESARSDNTAIPSASSSVKPAVPLTQGLAELNSDRPDDIFHSHGIEERQNENRSSESDESPENLSSQEALRLAKEAAAEADAARSTLQGSADAKANGPDADTRPVAKTKRAFAPTPNRASPEEELMARLQSRRIQVDMHSNTFEGGGPPEPVMLLFPGQGCETLGMLGSAPHENSTLSQMLRTSRQTLGYDLADLCANGPESKLFDTRFSHPAIYVASLAALERLKAERPKVAARPMGVAGLAAGELAALVAAGVLDFETGLRLAVARGDALHMAEGEARAARVIQVWVTGLTLEELEQLCEKAVLGLADGATCSVASAMIPKKILCAGTMAAALRLKVLVEGEGGKAQLVESERDQGTGAVHTPRAASAKMQFEKALAKEMPSMRPSRCPIYFCATGQSLPAGSSPEAVGNLVGAQLTCTVLWEQSMRRAIVDGAQEFIELGPAPGRQLTGLLRRIDPKSARKAQSVTT